MLTYPERRFCWGIASYFQCFLFSKSKAYILHKSVRIILTKIHPQGMYLSLTPSWYHVANGTLPTFRSPGFNLDQSSFTFSSPDMILPLFSYGKDFWEMKQKNAYIIVLSTNLTITFTCFSLRVQNCYFVVICFILQTN